MRNRDFDTYYDLLHKKPPSIREIEEEIEDGERKTEEKVRQVDQTPKIESDTKAFLDIFKYVFQPSYASLFDKTGYVTCNLITDWQDICSFTIPGGCEGLLKHVGMDSSSTSLNATQFYWRLLLNGSPFRDYEEIHAYPKDYLIQFRNFEYVTVLNPNDTITLQGKKTSLSGDLIYGRIKGWYWKI